jgi:hypothetical protein
MKSFFALRKIAFGETVMAEITSKDVKIFGKVLKRLGQLIEEHPEKLLDLLVAPEKQEPDEVPLSESVRFPELDDISIFEMAKNMSREELLSYLQRYDVEQLRHLIRRFRFGALKSRSAQVLAEHIADQAMKRAVDVFKSHE